MIRPITNLERLELLCQRLRSAEVTDIATLQELVEEGLSAIFAGIEKSKEKEMKRPRAKATYTRRYSHAELTTPDRTVNVHVKLLSNGELVFTVYHDGKESHREFSRHLNYDD